MNEAQEANLLFLYDTDNPASYNDPHLTPNPFGEGQIFFDSSEFGPFDAHGHQAALDQFRITGFGMGGNRCIGGPAQTVTQVDDGVLADANACTGPVGGNEPGGITFKGLQDVELNLGAGNNLFTIHDTPPSTLAAALNTGAGDDVVNVKKIEGHTFVNRGAGNDTVNVSNTHQQLSDLLGLLTVSGDSPQANVVNLTNGSPAQGTAVDAVNAEQKLTVDGTGGTFTLTYAPTPLNLTASQAPGQHSGSLAKGTYYYVVTAIVDGHETLASPETFATVSANGAVDLTWYAVPRATAATRSTAATPPGGENVLVATTSDLHAPTPARAARARRRPRARPSSRPSTLHYGDSADDRARRARRGHRRRLGRRRRAEGGQRLQDPLPGRLRRHGDPAALHRPVRPDERRRREGRAEHRRQRLCIDRGCRRPHLDLADRARPADGEPDPAARDRRERRDVHAHLHVPARPARASPRTTGTAAGHACSPARTTTASRRSRPAARRSPPPEVAALTAPNGSVNLTWDAGRRRDQLPDLPRRRRPAARACTSRPSRTARR